VRGTCIARIEGTVMRRSLAVLCLFGLVSHATAAEFELPTLRGASPFIPEAPRYMRWGGVYVGGQFGGASANMNFGGATESLISHMLRETALEQQSRPSEWEVLGKNSTSGAFGGGFVGFNTQWDDAMLGIELHYNGGRFFTNAPVQPITRTTSAGGNAYLLNISGDASMRITDFGSARVRAGWITGNILPYATVGFAFGRADITRTANVSGVENPATPCTPAARCSTFSFSESASKDGAWMYGWSVGGGIDMMLMPRVFVRAEYEYLRFTKVEGIQAWMHTGRLGAGYRF
jgi:outer membrane immunogenic protein